ncbi:MAG: DUF4234 domain-containing protein [Clostridia bacterium]|nr:DUF4234 domain-containing protein [Clostridia bacterium]
MYCPNCNGYVQDNAAFCPNCGAQFAAAQPQYQQQAQYQPPQQQYAAQPQYQQPQQPQYAAQPQYQQPQPQYQQPGPVAQLRTNRSLAKVFFLSLITLGIYGLVCYGNITDDVNTVCSRYDGKKSMNYYLLFFIIAPITLGIAAIVWTHNICNRIGDELKRRQINYSFSASDFWLWCVLGSLIVVGPFIFTHKFMTAMNRMNESFNMYG